MPSACPSDRRHVALQQTPHIKIADVSVSETPPFTLSRHDNANDSVAHCSAAALFTDTNGVRINHFITRHIVSI